MALIPIVSIPDPVLRAVSEPVTDVTDGVRKLLDDMADTMYDAPGRVIHGISHVIQQLADTICDVGHRFRDSAQHRIGYRNNRNQRHAVASLQHYSVLLPDRHRSAPCRALDPQALE